MGSLFCKAMPTHLVGSGIKKGGNVMFRCEEDSHNWVFFRILSITGYLGPWEGQNQKLDCLCFFYGFYYSCEIIVLSFMCPKAPNSRSENTVNWVLSRISCWLETLVVV
ncbi:hypothetical protein SLA2020_168540 [Shorea laevis]